MATDWWFSVGSGRCVVNVKSSSGPCHEAAYWGSNAFDIGIDFAAGALPQISFVCMDASRPPDGTAWTLFYYLEP